jgi:dihydrofolate reductase
MIISIIVAMDKNSLIGIRSSNKMPWHLPTDLAYFKKQTINKPVIMGTNTYKSLQKPLPQRQNIVISNSLPTYINGIEIVRNPSDAIKKAKIKDEIMVIGGAQIFKIFLPQADRLYITHIQHEFNGDIYFPKYDKTLWQKTKSTIKNTKNELPCDFALYERIRS